MRNTILTVKIILLSIFASSQVTRQPYLQVTTPNSMVVRWQTGTGIIGELFYGSSASSLTKNIKEPGDEKIYHEIKVT